MREQKVTHQYHSTLTCESQSGDYEIDNKT